MATANDLALNAIKCGCHTFEAISKEFEAAGKPVNQVSPALSRLTKLEYLVKRHIPGPNGGNKPVWYLPEQLEG